MSTTPSPCRAYVRRRRRAGVHRAGEARTGAEPRGQHVLGVVAVALLRPAVRDAGHPERGRVVVRGLLGVADQEADVVDARAPGTGRRRRRARPRRRAASTSTSSVESMPVMSPAVAVVPVSMAVRRLGNRYADCTGQRCAMRRATRLYAGQDCLVAMHRPARRPADRAARRRARIGVLECSRRLRVARGTVQARLDKLIARGVIRGFGPELDPAALGFGVTAFVTLEIRQRLRPRPGRRAPGRASPRCWRRTPSPAPATCCAGSWPGPTPTCSG